MNEMYEIVRSQIASGYYLRLGRVANFAYLYGRAPIVGGRSLHVVDGQHRLAAATREGWEEALHLLIQAATPASETFDWSVIRASGDPIPPYDPEARNPCREIAISRFQLDVEMAFFTGNQTAGLGAPFQFDITIGQYKYIAASLFLWMAALNGQEEDAAIVRSLLADKCNKKKRAQLHRKATSQSCKLIVDAFYRQYPTGWWLNFRQMFGYMMAGGKPGQEATLLESYCMYLTALFYDAKGPGLGQMPASWRTGTVLSIMRQMKVTGDFSGGPVLADALMDAGCEVESLLSHLRTSPLSAGGWLYRAAGML